MSVRVNEVIGVAGYVLPGTHVDILTTANPPAGPKTSPPRLCWRTWKCSPPERGGARPTISQTTVTVVTLVVTPQEAERLTLASTEGKIQLALRNPMDLGTPDTPGIRPGGLLGMSVPKAAAVRRAPAAPGVPAAPVPPPTIEMIKGDKRSTVAVG